MNETLVSKILSAVLLALDVPPLVARFIVETLPRLGSFVSTMLAHGHDPSAELNVALEAVEIAVAARGKLRRAHEQAAADLEEVERFHAANPQLEDKPASE